MQRVAISTVMWGDWGGWLVARGRLGVPVAPLARRPVLLLQWIKYRVLFSMSLGACVLVLAFSVFTHHAAVQGAHHA